MVSVVNERITKPWRHASRLYTYQAPKHTHTQNKWIVRKWEIPYQLGCSLQNYSHLWHLWSGSFRKITTTEESPIYTLVNKHSYEKSTILHRYIKCDHVIFNHNVSSPEGNTRFKFLGIPSLDQKKKLVGRIIFQPNFLQGLRPKKPLLSDLHRVRSAPVNFNGESSPQTRRENKRSLQSSWLDTYNGKKIQYYPN